jgi:hypothetical protein
MSQLKLYQSTKEPKATDTRCPKQFKCDGTLHTVTSRLEEALGRLRLECSDCHRQWSIKIFEVS